jgi:hypothetical protein
MYSARIYWMKEGVNVTNNEADLKEMVEDIRKISGIMRTFLAKEINLRRTPELIHHVDPYISLRRKAEDALDQARSQRPVEQSPDDKKYTSALEALRALEAEAGVDFGLPPPGTLPPPRNESLEEVRNPLIGVLWKQVCGRCWRGLQARLPSDSFSTSSGFRVQGLGGLQVIPFQLV